MFSIILQCKISTSYLKVNDYQTVCIKTRFIGQVNLMNSKENKIGRVLFCYYD